MHVRQQIREAIKTVLTGINIDSSQGAVTVYANRRRAVPAGSLPAIRVQTPSENSQFETMSSLQREPTVLIEIITEDKESNSVTPDDYAEEVEKLMADPAELKPLVSSHVLTSTTLQIDSEHNIEQMTLAYSIEYFTTPDAPEVAL